jgi:hypothetical protein
LGVLPAAAFINIIHDRPAVFAAPAHPASGVIAPVAGAGIRLRAGQRGTTIFGMEPVQITERLTLRQFMPADADDLLELVGDPRVKRYLDSTTKSPAQIRAEVLPRFLAYYARYRSFGFWGAPRQVVAPELAGSLDKMQNSLPSGSARVIQPLPSGRR